MSDRTGAAAVIYAKDVARVSAFYAAVTQWPITHNGADHAVVESPALQLFVVAVPPAIAARIRIEQPPVPRQDTALKLVLPVGDLAQARHAAAGSGGALKASEAEWEFNGHRHCDGHDPEGNVFQLRQHST